MSYKLCKKNRSLLVKCFVKHIPQLAAISLDTSLPTIALHKTKRFPEAVCYVQLDNPPLTSVMTALTSSNRENYEVFCRNTTNT
jgi:hypothetical protein